jgi:hypothetical protein
MAVLDDGSEESNQFDRSTVELKEALTLPVDAAGLGTQLGDAARAVRGMVQTWGLDRIVVRSADFSSRQGLTDGTTRRLMLEGAITAAVQHVVPQTEVRSGRSCGTVFGADKGTLDAIASELVVAARGKGDPKLSGAVAAALSGVAQGRL